MKIQFKKMGLFDTFLSLVIIIGLTTVLYLYTSGYRLNKNENNNLDIGKTGMVNTKSVPDGANVYLDGKLVTATDNTIPSIEPGEHTIKIVKSGFVEWQKNITVYEELVTDITAVLISQSPRLEPLTNTGAKQPSISPTMTKLAYFSKDTENPGIWLIPLSGNAINIFRSNPTIAIEDTKFTKYSEGTSITWSPDEKELLVEGANNIFYLIDLTSNTAQTTQNSSAILEEWQAEFTEKRSDFVATLEIPENVKQMAVSSKTMWAPDEKKFLYTVQNGEELEYRVYNLEDPIPVGEQRESLVFKTSINDIQPKISWYSDSFHLVIVEGDIETNNKGTVSLIRIDGTNKVEIYNNTLFSDIVYSAPGGDKFIILTSFKSTEQTDLYTVGIR